MKKMQDDILKVLLSEEEILAKVQEIGRQITEDYQDKNLLMVSVLKGSVVFMADLMRSVDCHARIDFMSVSSVLLPCSTSLQEEKLTLHRIIPVLKYRMSLW